MVEHASASSTPDRTLMPRLADVPPRVDPPASSKHLFNRDPLLIPQLFVDIKPRWYQRPPVVVAIVLCSLVMLSAGVAVRLYTIDGLSRQFSALVSRSPGRR